MSVNGKFDDITRTDLLAEADRFAVPRAGALVGDIRSTLENWKQHAMSAGLNESETDELGRDFLLLWWKRALEDVEKRSLRSDKPWLPKPFAYAYRSDGPVVVHFTGSGGRKQQREEFQRLLRNSCFLSSRGLDDSESQFVGLPLELLDLW
jgi:hypothetical protein